MKLCCLDCFKKKYPLITEECIVFSKEKYRCEICGKVNFLPVAYNTHGRYRKKYYIKRKQTDL